MKKIAVCIIGLFILTYVHSASAVERRSCHCGFTSGGDCKPCGGGGSAIRGKRCMYGYDEQGNCLTKNETNMKQCMCGYDAGKCLPCKDSLIEQSESNKPE